MSSRERPGRVGTVPVWYAVVPPGALLLFGESWSRRVERWRSDPWARLRVPATRVSAEAAARVLDPGEVRPHAEAVVDRWDTAGATTVEGLLRLVEQGSHVVVLIEGPPGGSRRAPAG